MSQEHSLKDNTVWYGLLLEENNLRFGVDVVLLFGLAVKQLAWLLKIPNVYITREEN